MLPAFFVIINKSAMNIHTLTQLRAHIFLQTSASRFVWEILKSGRASSKDKYILWAASKLASKTAVIHTSTRNTWQCLFSHIFYPCQWISFNFEWHWVYFHVIIGNLKLFFRFVFHFSFHIFIFLLSFLHI